ncbi:MAG: M48 family metallopeptidase, partial [Actinomycetes bacterium]
AWRVPWQWVPGGHLVPMPEHRLFTDAQVARAEHYSAVQRALGWTPYFLGLAVALWLGLTDRGARLLRRVAGRLRWWLAVPAGVLVLTLVGWLVDLPFAVAAHHQDLRVGLTHQGYAGWAADQGRSLLVGWVMTSLLALVVVGFARRSPRYWFAWAGGAALLLTLAGSFLYPVVVEPLFNRFTPMPAGPLRTQILDLAAREGVHVHDVLVADASRRTTTVNAYVSGFGSTRRVVVYDTLLQQLTPAQVRVVVAHELGHARNGDVLLGTALGAVGGLAAVTLLALLLDRPGLLRRAGVRGAGDPAAVALLMALVAAGGFLVSPVQNTVSRAIEARADRASLAATHEDGVFVQMQKKLALASLQDPTPPALSQLWWGSHPTVLQRAGLPASLAEARR